MTTRTVVDVVADGLVRHGITLILGQSVPTALVLACEDRGIRNVAYRHENMGGDGRELRARFRPRAGRDFARTVPPQLSRSRPLLRIWRDRAARTRSRRCVRSGSRVRYLRAVRRADRPGQSSAHRTL